MTTIDFTGAPEIPAFSTAPVSVSRALTEAANVPTREAAAGTPHQGADPAAADAPAGADPDEIYEQVVERLRRDLIAELEQHGHLLRETF